MQQALDALDMACAKYGDVGNIHTDWGKWDAAGTALRDELAKPEQAIVPFPSFMRKRIEEAIDNAISPKGMSVHDGKATVYASDLQRMIAVIDLAPPRKEWVGLTEHEIWECQKPGLSDDVYKLIEVKFKGKNT
jgi:hypothetical protein